ncbi:O-antigen polysaccharide polymerase Wzy [Nonlabens sp. Asnod3-A02]|uniref:O-antigen polysaccharide polymerase Wzy n=1 Tax=Nonlabens sp. Asnod3-A02 TaxID=3160579 RepID=UPI00386BF0CE
MILRNIFIFVYLFITVLLFATFEATLELWFAFFGNAVLLTFITYYHIFIEKSYSPFLSAYIVFSFLFFLVAPVTQANILAPLENGIFDHYFPYKEHLFLKANGLVAIFHTSFFLFYVGTKGYIRKKKVLYQPLEPNVIRSFRNILLIILISIIIIPISFSFIIEELARPEYIPSSFSPGAQLIQKKILFIIPLAGIVLCKYVFDRKAISTQTWIINLVLTGILLLLLLYFKNPLVEKRNALGPIYLLLLFLFFPRLFNSNVKMSLTLFVIMIVFFPLAQIITHSDYGISEMLENPSLFSNVIDKGSLSKGFMSLNYDAFCNMGIVIEIVEEDGLFYGFQLLSALLFFIPRSIWEGKPDSSGIIVGDHLIEKYDYYFANLSNPVVAEGYMNFGLLGVVFMAFILAISIVFFLTWLNSSDYLKKAVAFYFAMHMLFLLRGDFTNGYSYFIGTLIGLYVIPKMIINLSNFIFEQKVWVSKKS